MTEYDQNHYGMALTNYTLAYIHQRFADQLCDSRIASNVDYEDYLLGDVKLCHKTANRIYREAFNDFHKMHHYMGMYMSKLREIEAIMDDEDFSPQEIAQEQTKLQHLLDELQSYHTEVGIDKSCYIQRE